MLSPEFYETAPYEISVLLNTTQNWTIQQIASRINAANKITATADYQLHRLRTIREFDAAFKVELAELTTRTLEEIDTLFAQTAQEAYIYDKALYEHEGIPFTPYNKNAQLQQLTRSMSQQTKDEFKNLTRTTGFTNRKGQLLPHREYFTQKLDEVTTQVATGVTSYDEAIKRTVQEMTASGLKTVEYPNAPPRRIETVARATILTGIHQLAGQVTWYNIEQLGCELVETSAHSTARPEHQVWQGRRFALNGFRPQWG